MRKLTMVLFCAVIAVIAGLVSSQAWGAGVDGFLRLDGVQGESSDPKHKDEIEVTSWAFAEPPAGAVSHPGRKRLELVITKNVDKSSPRLFQAFVTAERFREGRLSLQRSGGANPAEFMKYRMFELHVVSYNVGGTGSVPLETIVFGFQKSEVEYRPQNRDGSLGQPVTTRTD